MAKAALREPRSVPRKGRVGRPRLRSECFVEHVPGVDCSRCRRARQQRWRSQGPDVERLRVRERTEEEREADKARAYVWTYLRRGKIAPAPRCEICGGGGPLVFWQPDLRIPRQLVWLCPADRKRVASTVPTITLTWLWPGDRLSSDSEVREVQSSRAPLGSSRVERRLQREAQRIEQATARAAVPLQCAVPIDEVALFRRLDAAEREVDELLARVAARAATFEERRLRSLSNRTEG